MPRFWCTVYTVHVDCTRQYLRASIGRLYTAICVPAYHGRADCFRLETAARGVVVVRSSAPTISLGKHSSVNTTASTLNRSLAGWLAVRARPPTESIAEDGAAVRVAARASVGPRRTTRRAAGRRAGAHSEASYELDARWLQAAPADHGRYTSVHRPPP